MAREKCLCSTVSLKVKHFKNWMFTDQVYTNLQFFYFIQNIFTFLNCLYKIYVKLYFYSPQKNVWILFISNTYYDLYIYLLGNRNYEKLFKYIIFITLKRIKTTDIRIKMFYFRKVQKKGVNNYR